MASGKQIKLPRLNVKLSAEDRLFLSKYGPVISRLRRNPTLIARLLHGVVIPPHQRSIWRGMWCEFRENHIVGSRGIAKSAAVCSMAFAMRAETTKNRKYLPLSASKFRGGKLIMEEASDFIMGRFKGQKQLAPFGSLMMDHSSGTGIKREGDRWTIKFSSHSQLATIPTGNHESAKGWRANWLALDEADNWQRAVIVKYFEPFLAVGAEFENTAEASGNALFMTGTVTYAHTDWAMTLTDREAMLSRRYDAQRALLNKEFDKYFRMMDENNGRLWKLSVLLQRWDYTDLIIPLEIKDPNNELNKFEVYYPVINRSTHEIQINPHNMIRFDYRDQCKYLFTYPIEKDKIEEPLDDGLTDIDVWAAENRCMIINASGGTYPRHLLDRATDTQLLEDKVARERGWNVTDWGPYVPPLLYECQAPCVLGVDPARTDDFSAFTIIRLGMMENEETPYNPLTGEGYTQWNNVIWAEMHRHLTIRDIAQKIRELKSRYNLVVTSNPALAYAIGIDARGAASGTTVQDELARPTPDVDDHGITTPGWIQPQIIYDPEDDSYKHLMAQTGTWPGLRLLWTSDALNTEWVSFSKGQMEQGKLYIAKYKGYTERHDTEDKYRAGYAGVQSLKAQLMKMQSIPTKYHLKFEIPGDPKKLENKDDMFKSFLYAVSAMKAHLATMTRKRNTQPVIAVGKVTKDTELSRLAGRHGWSRIKF